MDVDPIVRKAADAMPELVADLERLVAIPSIAFPGYPAEPVERMGQVSLDLFQKAGFRDARLMDVPSGYPPIYAELPGPEGSPVVVLYAHYDVQPAPPEQGWSSEPWTPTRKDDGRIYGRGAADDISGLIAHLGTMRVFDGRPPCTVKLILEGMEETESNLEAFVEAHPELFACDLFIVCDMGNLRVGDPVFTTALRGDVACIVTVRTLEHSLHSGVFGGPAPDAMMSLARLLATLHDDNGDVAVENVSTGSWTGEQFTQEDLRASADVLDGVALTGTGAVGDRLWAHPSINAIGIDMTSIAGSSNVLIPEASAKISMRIVPGRRPGEGAGRAGHPPGDACTVGREGGSEAHQGGAPVPLRDRRPRLRRSSVGDGAGLRKAGRRGGLRRLHPVVAHSPDGRAQGGVHPLGRRGHGEGPHPRLG
jgi:acetylornithine deacetylase/succinyl-diaminopimelate desuccinylase-like protein